MHEAGPLIGVVTSLAAGAPQGPVQSRLLLALEAIVEPVVTVLSLWTLVLRFEGELSSLWLVASVLAFALAFPGRSQLRLPANRVFVNTMLAWGWTAGLLLATAYATGHIDDFSHEVVLNWLWFAPACQLLAHGALRVAAPFLVKMQGPPLRAVVVGMNEQGCSLADRLSVTSDTGIELGSILKF